MHPMSALSQYAVLTAMLAPAFFLTATAALLTTANARLSRVIDRVRSLLRELEECSIDDSRQKLESLIGLQRRRIRLILRASQLLYVAISCFVGTSLSLAGDAFLGNRVPHLPTLLAVLGVLSMFTSSLLLAREAALAVGAVNDEMDDAHGRVNRIP
jgi:hypothetical protein